MMTFEEFFAKKKIDLALLRVDNNPLYNEFKQHYVEMGPKSFDHTKKFWFNKLRKQYALPDEASVVKKPTEAKITSVSPTAAIEEAPSSKPSGFKPRFKAGAAKPAAAADSDVPDKSTGDGGNVSTSSSKPSGFKPRFKSGVTKPVAAADSDVPDKPTGDGGDVSTSSSKPSGFKPRFKSGVTKPAAAADSDVPDKPTGDGGDVSTSSSKPSGFKPRFKAGVTKTQPPRSEEK